MEKLNPAPKENPTLSVDLDDRITKLLDLTKEEWKEKWRTSEFTELFPNLTFRLLSLDGRNKYTQEQKQRIFELGFASFMELPWTSQGLGLSGKGIRMKANKETKLWEKETPRQVVPDTEPIIRLAIGSIILLGLNSKKKESINLIKEAYSKLGPNRRVSFRSDITRLISTKSVFRQWVQANKLDIDNGFEFDSEVANLALELSPQDKKLPNEFKDLKNYPPQVISKLVDHYILTLNTPSTSSMRSGINVFQRDLAERLTSDDFKKNPELQHKLQQKLNDLRSLIGQ